MSIGPIVLPTAQPPDSNVSPLRGWNNKAENLVNPLARWSPGSSATWTSTFLAGYSTKLGQTSSMILAHRSVFSTIAKTSIRSDAYSASFGKALVTIMIISYRIPNSHVSTYAREDTTHVLATTHDTDSIFIISGNWVTWVEGVCDFGSDRVRALGLLGRVSGGGFVEG